jgi:hypothetical protein
MGFQRSGVDLSSPAATASSCFARLLQGEKRAALASPDGAHLTGDIVNALAGAHPVRAGRRQRQRRSALIGHVTKLTGNATAIRNGVSIILNQGDTVHKGDVVQSGSDSTLGITFIDGTVFGLASNAKMVLNEMIYDPNGSDNKSLLSLVAGTISFVAGATAKKGDMKVDTPVATMGIRGTAVLVEIDFEVPSQGGAPPAKFQVLVEPDGTTGSYILFDKTTLTPIATVNRAGTQTIINGRGRGQLQSSGNCRPTRKIISDCSLKFSDRTRTPSYDQLRTARSFRNVFPQLASNDFIPVASSSTSDKPPLPQQVPAAHPFPGRSGAGGHLPSDRGTAAPTSPASPAPSAMPTSTPSVRASKLRSSFVYANAQRRRHRDADGENWPRSRRSSAALRGAGPNGKNTARRPDYHCRGAFDFAAGETDADLSGAGRQQLRASNRRRSCRSSSSPAPTTSRRCPRRGAIWSGSAPAIGGRYCDRLRHLADVDLTDRPSSAPRSPDRSVPLLRCGGTTSPTLTPAQLAAILAVQCRFRGAGGRKHHNGSATWTYSIRQWFDFIANGETLTLTTSSRSTTAMAASSPRRSRSRSRAPTSSSPAPTTCRPLPRRAMPLPNFRTSTSRTRRAPPRSIRRPAPSASPTST